MEQKINQQQRKRYRFRITGIVEPTNNYTDKKSWIIEQIGAVADHGIDDSKWVRIKMEEI
jgi:hypothetical protein